MQKARYAPQPLGHYGLVLADYAHFTSPIRRYPDLAIHRILTEMLNGVSASQLQRDFNEFAQQASEKSSKQEVAAVRIERDVEDLYKAEYMHTISVRSTPARWPASRPAASLSSWTTRWRALSPPRSSARVNRRSSTVSACWTR